MTEAWAYYNANTIEIIGDVSAYYWPNQLVSITQTTQRFFVVVGVAVVGGNTHLTVSGGGIYALANAPITAHAVTANAGISGLPSGFLAQGLAYGATSKDTPADDDIFSYWDSAASFIRKKITFANLKTALNLLYAPIAKGVTNGDSHDHSGGDGAELSQYVALAGRAGGQTVEGDTSSGGNLTLKSTHHATKGKIILGTSVYDEANNKLGIGIASPYWDLDIYGGAGFNNGKTTIWSQGGEGETIKLTGANGTIIFVENINGSWRLVNHAWSATLFSVDQSGNAYIAANCSALSFTDRTDAFVGDALAAIEKIAADAEGNIDHSTLPEFAQAVYTDAEGKEQAGRDIGNMVSVLTTGMQQLIAENTSLKERLKKLEGE